MENPDPFLTQAWPWNIHFEFRNRYVSPENLQIIKDIMEGKPSKVKAEQIEPQEYRRIVSTIISDAIQEMDLDDIYYKTLAMLEAGYFNLEDDEVDKAYNTVLAWMDKSTIEIHFKEQQDEV